MVGTTITETDLIHDLDDLDEREFVATLRRWYELSKLVAPSEDERKAYEERS